MILNIKVKVLNGNNAFVGNLKIALLLLDRLLTKKVLFLFLIRINLFDILQNNFSHNSCLSESIHWDAGFLRVARSASEPSTHPDVLLANA